MGTSGSHGGPGRTPLLPTWADQPLDGGGNPATPTPNTEPALPQDGQRPQQPSPHQPTNHNPIQLNRARNEISNYAGGDEGALGRSLGHYVRSRGGAQQAARADSSAKRTTKRFGGFIANVGTRGIAEAANQLGLSNVVGKSVDQALAAIIDAIVPRGASVDESVAREALSRTFDELYKRYGLDQGIENLNQITAEGAREAVELTVSGFIYERFLFDVQAAFEQLKLTVTQVIRLERDAKVYISDHLKNRLDGIDVLHLDWNGLAGSNLVEQTYADAYAILEALL